MRWIHIDDMLELREGEFAKAVKAVPSNADYLEEHFPGFPVMPESLLIESMAQAAGILIGKSLGFKKDIILAKIDSAEFLFIARPGDRLIIEAGIEDLREEGARVSCCVKLADKVLGSATLIFAILSEDDLKNLGTGSFVFSGSLIELFKLRNLE